MQEVKDAAPGRRCSASMFVVRRRKLTNDAAADLLKRLKPGRGDMTPYQAAAADALRRHTGQSFHFEPSPEAWRQFLKKKA